MSFYPRPTNASNIFNEIDYTNNDDNDNNDDFDHTKLLFKTGGSMTGPLRLPQITFTNDESSQSTAFTSQMANDIGTVADKLTLITNDNANNEIIIDNLRVKKIIFDDDVFNLDENNVQEDQVNAFNNTKRLQLNANTGNISSNTQSINTNTSKLVPVTTSLNGDVSLSNKLTVNDLLVVKRNGQGLQMIGSHSYIGGYDTNNNRRF